MNNININYFNPTSLSRYEEWVPYRLNPFFMISSFGRLFDRINGVIRVSYKRPGERYLYYPEINEYIHVAMMHSFNYFPGCENLSIKHKDGNPLTNYLPNLEYVDYYIPIHNEENDGERNYRAQYTEDQIIKVCELLQEDKYSSKQISEITGVAEHVVNSVKFGNSWKHISCNYKFNVDAMAHRTIKYPDEVIHKICKQLQDNPKKPIYEIAKDLNLSKNLVQSIASRTTRTDISDNYTWDDLKERNYNYRYDYIKEEATKLINEGNMSLIDISKQLNVPKDVIYNLKRKINNPSNKYKIISSDDDIKEISKYLSDSNLSYSEISDKTGFSRDSIYRLNKKLSYR